MKIFCSWIGLNANINKKNETLCQSKVLLGSNIEKVRFVFIDKFRGFEKRKQFNMRLFGTCKIYRNAA
jgi:hypothetical protein